MANVTDVAASQRGIDFNSIFDTIKNAASTVKTVKDTLKAPTGVASYQQPSAFTTNTGSVNWMTVGLVGAGLVGLIVVVKMIKKKG